MALSKMALSKMALSKADGRRNRAQFVAAPISASFAAIIPPTWI